MPPVPQTPGTTTNQAPPPSNSELRAEIRQAVRNALVGQRIDGGRVGTEPVIAPPPAPPGGVTIQHTDSGRSDFPPEVVDISIAFFIMCAVMVIGWPLARAFGKRLERKGDAAQVSPAMLDQLQRIEQAVDTMAIEIERISESQRFMAKLQSAQSLDRVALPPDRP